MEEMNNTNHVLGGELRAWELGRQTFHFIPKYILNFEPCECIIYTKNNNK